MRIDVITPAAEEPVTLIEAKTDRRVVLGSDDASILSKVAAARDYVERIIGYPLVTQTLRGTLDAFPATIVLTGKNITITSIAYTDTDGVEHTLDPTAYDADVSGGGARIVPAYGTQWPATRKKAAAVRVVYQTGRPVADVPPTLKAAMLLIMGDLYENREGAVTQQGITVTIENPTVDNLIFPHRIVLP